MPYQNPYFPQTTFQPFQQQQQTPTVQYPTSQYSAQQPVHGFVYVTGLEGAKAYQMPPNSEMPLFDSTSDNRMFIKTTDGAGFPTIKVAHCSFEESQPQSDTEYASIEELNALRSEIEDLRRAIYEGASHGKHVSQAAE
jgi:hypothetical protein